MADALPPPIKLEAKLELERCPHCSVDRPNLSVQWQCLTADHANTHERLWMVYACDRCGGLVTAGGRRDLRYASEIYPAPRSVDADLPAKARAYLEQAYNSLHAPAGAVMLAGSAVDAMLKAKGLVEGSLYSRIDRAAADGTITADMAAWAHDVRLDANDQRHADQAAPMPTTEDAERSVEFAAALGTFMFVLPARVRRGMKARVPGKTPE